MQGVRRSAYFVFRAPTLALQSAFVFVTVGRTDTLRENNDLFGRGLMCQYLNLYTSSEFKMTHQAQVAFIS